VARSPAEESGGRYAGRPGSKTTTAVSAAGKRKKGSVTSRTSEGIGREPDIHHIKPVREFDDPADAHQLDNVVCLCRSCHRTVESG